MSKVQVETLLIDSSSSVFLKVLMSILRNSTEHRLEEVMARAFVHITINIHLKICA